MALNIRSWVEVATKISLVVYFFIAGHIAFAQNQYSISFENNTIVEALNKIEDLEGVKLSFSPDIFNDSDRVTLAFTDKELYDILGKILPKEFESKRRGSYYIIQRKTLNTAKEEVKISGNITDAATGETIKDVTVYEVNELASTLTNKDGDFDFTVSSKRDYITIAVSREHYLDTMIRIDTKEGLRTPLVLRSKPEKESKLVFYKQKVMQFFTSKEAVRHSRNVDLDEKRPIQLSVVPGVGTNGKLSAQIQNNFSFNLFSGFNHSVDGCEIGGLYNILRHDVNGAQVGGFGNTIGGKVNGAQIGGFINTSGGSIDGVQVAGFNNVAIGAIDGAQISGFSNVSKRMNGVQIAGFSNISSKNVDGVQVAGFSNISTDWIDGVQISGFSNFAKNDADGCQIAGFHNTSKNMKGIQVSGGVNTARDLAGTQISALANYANNMEGLQLGLFNLADSIVSGGTIGLVNISRNGKLEAGIEHSDFMDAILSFRSGAYHLYSILAAGYDRETKLLAGGFGLGSQLNYTPKIYNSLELITQQAWDTKNPDRQHLNLMNRVLLNFGYSFARHLSINAGPTLNVYVANIKNAETPRGNIPHSQTLYKTTEGDIYIAAWMGFNVGLRF